MPEVTIAPPAPAAAPASTATPGASKVAPRPAPAPAAAPEKPSGGNGTGKPPVAKAKPVSTAAEDMNDAYSQLDRLAGPQSDELAETPDAKPAPGEADDEIQPGDAPETTDQPQANEPEKPVKAGTLRKLFESTKAEKVKLEGRVKELEAQIKQPKDDPEKAKLAETLTQREKRLQELEDDLRFTNYERSEDYKTRYEKPFMDAYNTGRAKVSAMKFDDGAGTIRQGTAEDFDSFMRITDDDQAAEKAQELFGARAASVLYHRERVQEMNQIRVNALEEYRKNGGEREKQRSELRTKQQKEIANIWETEAKTAVDKYKWFQPEEGDDEGNRMLEKGFRDADLAFGVEVKGDDGKAIKKTPQDMAKLHAAIRNKAAAFDRQVYLNSKLKKDLKAAQKRLDEFEKSVPGPGNGRGTRNAPMSSWDAIDADLARRANR